MTSHVLVTDDSATVRAYHDGILAAAGFRVAQAANGYEAYEMALLDPFDLFVIDVNMPRLDGYSLVEMLRAHPQTAALPVIMISTESTDADAARAYAAGANVYLVKPVRAERLVSVAELLADSVEGSP